MTEKDCQTLRDGLCVSALANQIAIAETINAEGNKLIVEGYRMVAHELYGMDRVAEFEKMVAAAKEKFSAFLAEFTTEILKLNAPNLN